ncbi:unnamed protein product [Amoebophrya sp. A120]|nr:unnamed protein product [Amoebophrya sp. A120]|eukprot:GSA120T00024040001.1
MRGGFGASGQQQSQDCAFEAGKVNGTPIRVSYFLVIMFGYQILQALQQRAPVWWLPVAYAAGTQLILLATILCHEFGHGTMAKYLGGQISQILLWPFGGICFSTRPGNVYDGRTKIKNEMKIVCAGPATHFFQAPFWVLLLQFQAFAYDLDLLPLGFKDRSELWQLLIPFAPQPPVPFEQLPNLFAGLGWMLCVWAATTNVFLFLFNVLFPMYPMDSAQMLVCGLQLCGGTAQTAAKTLVFVSVPMSVLLLIYAWSNRNAGMMPAISGYLAIMCLIEAYNIWQLYEKRQLHTHRLFELARSGTYFDPVQNARRINVSGLDDDLNAGGDGRNRGFLSGRNNNDYVLFEGQGTRLGGENDDVVVPIAAPTGTPMPNPFQAPGSGGAVIQQPAGGAPSPAVAQQQVVRTTAAPAQQDTGNRAAGLFPAVISTPAPGAAPPSGAAAPMQPPTVQRMSNSRVSRAFGTSEDRNANNGVSHPSDGTSPPVHKSPSGEFLIPNPEIARSLQPSSSEGPRTVNLQDQPPTSSPATGLIPPTSADRQAFLARMERQRQEQAMSVRELAEARDGVPSNNAPSPPRRNVQNQKQNNRNPSGR